MIIRILFIASLLVWVVTLDELLPIFLFTLFSVLVLFSQGFKLNYMFKSLRLLMWLFIPTLFFHGLFTPGKFIQEPVYIPLSIEGLSRGLYLSAHIALIFFCALLIFRIFSKQEWLSLMGKLPLGVRLKMYVVLLMALKIEVTQVLSQTQSAWLAHGKPWSRLPQMMVGSIQEVLSAAKKEARNLWKNWNSRMSMATELSIPLWSAKEATYLGILLIGWYLFWII